MNERHHDDARIDAMLRDVLGDDDSMSRDHAADGLVAVLDRLRAPATATERARATLAATEFADLLDATACAELEHRRRHRGILRRSVAIGGVGLLLTAGTAAATGALPDAAQDTVARALAQVGVDVPSGSDDESSEPVARSTAAPASRDAVPVSTDVVVQAAADHIGSVTPGTSDDVGGLPASPAPASAARALAGQCVATAASEGRHTSEALQAAAAAAGSSVAALCDSLVGTDDTGAGRSEPGAGRTPPDAVERPAAEQHPGGLGKPEQPGVHGTSNDRSAEEHAPEGSGGVHGKGAEHTPVRTPGASGDEHGSDAAGERPRAAVPPTTLA